MTVYYSDDYVTLHHAKAEEVLPTLDAVDHVIADPPYEVEAHTKARRVRAGGGVDVLHIPFDAITEEIRIVVANEIGRITRRWSLTFCQVEAAMRWRQCYEAAGLEYKRTCVWIKPDGAPQFTGDRPGIGYESFVAMHAKGPSRWNGGGRRGVFIRNVGTHADHPTQKPLTLMRELIGLFTDEGDVILDCFAGSGTTGLAAAALGRKAILVEMDERYAEVAAKRLSELRMQGVFDLQVPV